MSGIPEKPMPPAPEFPPMLASTSEERTWALLAHLSPFVAVFLGGMGFLGPLIVWLIKKETSPFVADQAQEALNFQLAVLIAMLVTLVTCVGPIVIAVGAFIYQIVAAVEANKGVCYRYPYTLRLIK